MFSISLIKNTIREITPALLLSAYHFLLSFLGAGFYGFPSRKLKIIGVTGTNGKSTVVFLINQILKEAGHRTASLSSIYFTINNDIRSNDLKMTMPGRFKIQKFLRRAVKEKCQYAVLEITSEGIKQHRHRFIGFDTAVFTNLTPEHLENHGGFENYKKAKGKLFRLLKQRGKAIVNLDDPNAKYFLRFAAKEKWGYTIDSEQRTTNNVKNIKIIEGEKIKIKKSYSSFMIRDSLFIIHLLGKFNAYNALAAILVGMTEKISLDKIKLVLEEVKDIPGRLEIVAQEPLVIVDYAHTPDALEKVYQTAEEMSDGKLIGVLGSAGGGRDKWKRPEMGKIAQQYLDTIIITNEDPYDEDPNQILSEIKSGISVLSGHLPKRDNLYEILDRREAIRKALSLAKLGDIVIITGKGCEPWMCIAGGKKIPWDDRKVVRDEMKYLVK